MNIQRCGKETCTEFSPSHVAAAINIHEQVTNAKPTDNEKTVTVERIAGIPVRNHQIVAFARHYSTSLQTCIPADPASKGGVENAVKIAKADLVPKDTNLLPEYRSFAELEAACEAFMEEVNSRVHRATLEIPKDMLRVLERPRLHPVPATPVTASFGQTRQVPPNTPMITFAQSRYSVLTP